MKNEVSGSPSRARLPHAVLDEPSRILKARKIIALVGKARFSQAKRILEIGCGSGVISSTLAKLGNDELKVIAVDVEDNRIVTEGYEFIKVDGTTLPFDDGSFDIVISNHVIEHVGDHSDQLRHLLEISRVMKLSGCTYLAVPNKWRIIEPHYRLPVLSWVPTGLADLYVRATRRGHHYDCLPLSRFQAEKIFREAGFRYREMTVEAVRSTLLIEFSRSRIAASLAQTTPSWLIALAKPLISTLIYRLRRAEP